MVSTERREIVDSARLTLGYIHFELSSFDTAIKFLKRISTTFYDYPDVLLAIGWSALKSENYQQALIALSKLVKNYPNDLNAKEAHFVLGQCYLRLGYYKFAINEYYQIINTSPVSNNFARFIAKVKSRLAKEELRVEALKTDLLLLESNLLDTIPINTGDGLPKYIKQERKRMEKEREQLVEKLIVEKELFDSVSESINSLKRQIGKREMQKDWRAYAEYGKARATFLRGLEEK
ncbi:MAG: tol-pal system YbgF family protein [bacterium]